jgi:tetratricopeptide (TPR) repeat protein
VWARRRHPSACAANNLAWLYQEQRRFDEALRWALLANDELRNRPEAQDTLGWIHVQRGNYNEALPLLASVVELRPDDPTYRYHLGFAYWKTGSFRAREGLQRAVRVHNGACWSRGRRAERVRAALDAVPREPS